MATVLTTEKALPRYRALFILVVRAFGGLRLAKAQDNYEIQVYGSAIYISLVEHPARMECGVEIAATEFSPSYRRATIMQATCAALGLLSSIAAWLAGATFWWLVAGVLLGLVIPFTLIVILPTNKRLLSPTLDRRSAVTGRLLARWGRWDKGISL